MKTIEFGLPTGAGGMAAAHYGSELRKELESWAKHHNQTLSITVSKHDYRMWTRVAMSEKTWVMFALSWQQKKTFMPYVLVDNENTV